jgi:hypothetical protein
MGTLRKEQFISLVNEIRQRNPRLAECMMAQYEVKAGGKPNCRVKGMTKPEKLWGLELRRQQEAGEIKAFVYEPFKMSLGERCTYTPDYVITLNDGTIRIDECKGPFIREDAMIKLKWVAQKYPEHIVRLCQRLKDGRWKISVIGRE